MAKRVLGLGFGSWLSLAGVLLGCGDGHGASEGERPTDSRETTSQDPSRPAPGGATGDFGGLSICAEPTTVASDEELPLGFSAREMIDTIAGRYVIPIAWRDPCDTGEACAHDPEVCSETRQRYQAPSFAGTETELTVEISEAGETAVNFCDRALTAPVQVSVVSADGALDERWELDVGAERIPYVTIVEDIEASDLSGALRDELPEDSYLEFDFGVEGPVLWMDLFFVPRDDRRIHPAPLLVDEILPASDERCNYVIDERSEVMR